MTDNKKMTFEELVQGQQIERTDEAQQRVKNNTPKFNASKEKARKHLSEIFNLIEDMKRELDRYKSHESDLKLFYEELDQYFEKGHTKKKWDYHKMVNRIGEVYKQLNSLKEPLFNHSKQIRVNTPIMFASLLEMANYAELQHDPNTIKEDFNVTDREGYAKDAKQKITKISKDGRFIIDIIKDRTSHPQHGETVNVWNYTVKRADDDEVLISNAQFFTDKNKGFKEFQGHLGSLLRKTGHIR